MILFLPPQGVAILLFCFDHPSILPTDPPVSYTREYMDRSNQRLANSKKLKILFTVKSGTREHQMQPDIQRMWSHVLPHIQ
jgi:hypothetical protein